MPEHFSRLIVPCSSSNAKCDISVITQPTLHDRAVKHLGWPK
jgi:hypothetical protein